MPLMHSCDSYALRAILDQGTIEPQPCPVYVGDSLAYFFYGRPAYRPGAKAAAASQVALFPACIILRPEAVLSIKRVAPFDTGGFARNAAEGHYHPKMQRDDFLLEPSLSAAQRVVGRFFGNNNAYFDAVPLPVSAVDDEFEVASYLSSLHDRSTSPDDDRRSTVEVQSDASVPLAAPNLAAVILPSGMMSQRIQDLLGATKAKVVTYPAVRGSPREYTAMVYAHARTILSSMGAL